MKIKRTIQQRYSRECYNCGKPEWAHANKHCLFDSRLEFMTFEEAACARRWLHLPPIYRNFYGIPLCYSVPDYAISSQAQGRMLRGTSSFHVVLDEGGQYKRQLGITQSQYSAKLAKAMTQDFIRKKNKPERAR